MLWCPRELPLRSETKTSSGRSEACFCGWKNNFRSKIAKVLSGTHYQPSELKELESGGTRGKAPLGEGSVGCAARCIGGGGEGSGFAVGAVLYPVSCLWSDVASFAKLREMSLASLSYFCKVCPLSSVRDPLCVCVYVVGVSCPCG